MKSTLLLAALMFVAADAAHAACTPSTSLSCGKTINDAITNSTCVVDGYPTNTYAFNATAGDTVKLSATTSSAVTIYLTIETPSGQQLVYDFDEPSVSVQTTIPSTGQYHATVSFGRASDRASYTLSLTCTASTNPPPPTTCSYSGTLTPGVPVTSSLGPEDGTACFGDSTYGEKWAFQATAGVPVQVTLTANFPPYLDVQTTDATNGLWRASRSNGTVTVLFLPETTGQHRIFVGSFTNTPASGGYTIRVENPQLDPCRRRAASH